MARDVTLQEALSLAFTAVDEGRLVVAEDLCRQILAAKPDTFGAHHLLGIAQSRLGKKTEALESYGRALALRPDSAEVFSNRGITLHQLRRYGEALENYDRALALAPNFADALSNRGNTLRETRRYEEALACYDRALATQPNHAQSLSNRGNILRELKQPEEALESYDRALAVHPDSADTLSNRGVTLHDLKRFEEALESYDRALVLQPNSAPALSNRGNTLHELKRYDEALGSYDRALTVNPDYPEALSNRGNTLRELKRFDEAVASYDRALALQPDYPEVAFNRGNALQGLQRFEDAVASYDRALGVQPHYAEVHSNRGTALYELQRFDEAVASCDRALAERPHYAQALSNRGNALRGLWRFDEALESYDRAIALSPVHADALVNRGNMLKELRRIDEALESYDRAIALQPDLAAAHFNEALCRILRGDYDRGFEKYEWRWECAQGKQAKRDFTQPLWLGSDDIAGKTILLHAEQGYGDTIQFCRYVPRVAALGARVILEVPKALQGLMAALEGPAQILRRGDALPAFDLHCPLLSLPLAFHTRLETIPSATPYLHAPAKAVAAWRKRLGRKRRPMIGVAWSGLATLGNDRFRSIKLAALLPLFDARATFVSLQKEVRAEDAALLKTRRDIIHFGDELRDFTDTAALIANLDLVIAVDTSVAHLAGALAKPLWMLLSFGSDWRWLLDRDDSPWYPTARLFRQGAVRSWDDVIAHARAALAELVSSRK